MQRDLIIISRQEAKQKGILRYFTGKPCKRGHIAERYVSTLHCADCLNAHSSIWKKAHRQSETAQKRAWTARNRDKVRALKKTYYATDERTRELQKKRARKWMENNREKYRASSARWRIANLDVAAAAQQRRRARLLRCMPEWVNHAEIQQFYARAKELSDATGVKHNVDHAYPLQGKLVTGLHVPWNLQVMTESDNKSKGTRLPDAWKIAA